MQFGLSEVRWAEAGSRLATQRRGNVEVGGQQLGDCAVMGLGECALRGGLCACAHRHGITQFVVPVVHLGKSGRLLSIVGSGPLCEDSLVAS